MSQETRCCIGDLMRAFDALAPDHDNDIVRAGIAQLLKIPWTSASQKPDASQQKVELPPPPSQPKPEEPAAAAPTPPPKLDQPRAPDRPLATTLSPIRSTPRQGPSWTRHTQPWQPFAAPVAPTPPEPLFPPPHTRAILAASVSTKLDRGELDLQFIVSKTARGEALSSVPRAMIPSIGRGLQLLVDQGSGMMPFRHDIEEIQKTIRSLVGGDALQLLNFAAAPTRGVESPGLFNRKGGRFSLDYWPRYAPAPGTRVICITDLGVGAGVGMDLPASCREWQTFARWIAESDCPLLVLTPYSPARRPQLARVLHQVHWDRRTTAASVTRLLRDKPR